MNSFKKNLIFGYGASLLLLLLSAAASYVSIRNLLDSQSDVEYTIDIIDQIETIRLAVREGEAGQRGYLLTRNRDFLIPYRGSQEAAIASAEKLDNLTYQNPEQRELVKNLRQLINDRYHYMQLIIDNTESGEEYVVDHLEKGRLAQVKLWTFLDGIEKNEQRLLKQKTEQTNRFASITPVLILIASLLAMIVTIVSFFKVISDLDKRQQMQLELQEMNEDISERIRITEDVTARIAAGNFTTRVSGDDLKRLGVLGPSINKMAKSLDESFSHLAQKEWQQTGIAELNELMIGEKNLESLSRKMIQFLTSYTRSGVGAVYLVKDDESMDLYASVNLDRSAARKVIKIGETTAGRAASSQELVLIQPVEEAELTIDFTGGSIKPRAVIAIPIFYEAKLKGVIEMASLYEYSNVDIEFLKTCVFNIGLAIHSAKDHIRLQELLAETQAQSEELQSQHSELENINAELEAQAEKLQASEEELRVQQEELQQANQELEERSRLLEEKNETILERNLEIQKKADELQESTRYKSEFLANMSHELRTPLNSILLLSRLLSENHDANLSDEQIEFSKIIESSGKGLLTLIDEILDLSKIEAGKMSLDYHDIPLELVSAELKKLFDPVAQDKNLEFHVEIDPQLPSSIEVDKLRLEQILRNLISNALKFTRKGSVTLNMKKSGSGISFTVRDTGIGIPESKQSVIFEAFQQADGSTRRHYGGTGLGLSISRELANLMGGQITLVSKEGEGSEFTLTIPMRQGGKISQPAPEHRAKPTEVTSSGDDNFLAQVIPPAVDDDRDNIKPGEKVILIIEDDIAFAKALLDYSRNSGYKGVVAVRGDEVLALALKFSPHGILLDIQLPVKSGWEVMEELKSNPLTRAIPVHVMSAHQVKHRSLTRGAVDFINKPVAFDKLGDVFQKLELALSKHPKKVLIVEENPKHAQALALFLENFQLSAKIQKSVDDSMQALNREDVDCVILDMGIPAQRSYEFLEDIKQNPHLNDVPIIVFTGQNLSQNEEMKIKQFADSIIVKTVNSYQRVLDEVSLFLHLVESGQNDKSTGKRKSLGMLGEVLKGKTVLVADDDVRNIFSLSRSLEKFGVNVISAIDGKDALHQLEENPQVDLVLMDMMMPQMDGYQSTRRIREIPRYRNLPVIAVTAKAMTGDREKCIAAGASDYITKPVDVDQLISLLRVWLYQN